MITKLILEDGTEVTTAEGIKALNASMQGKIVTTIEMHNGCVRTGRFLITSISGAQQTADTPMGITDLSLEHLEPYTETWKSDAQPANS